MIAQSVTITDAGDAIVAGYAESEQWSGGRRHTLMRYDASGGLLWEIDGPADPTNVLYGVALDLAGGIVGAGSMNTNAWLWRWTDDADETWTAEYGQDLDGTEVGEAVAVDSAGNVVMVGRVTSGWQTGHDALIAKYGPDGALVWSKEMDGRLK